MPKIKCSNEQPLVKIQFLNKLVNKSKSFSMKKNILTKKTWTLALCAFVLSSLLYVACSKDNATLATTDVTMTLPKQISEEEVLL